MPFPNASSWKKNVCIQIEMSLKFVHKWCIVNEIALVRIVSGNGLAQNDVAP